MAAPSSVESLLEHRRQRHPADEMVASATEPLPEADDYIPIEPPPTGALLKADDLKLILSADKEGRVRMTCASWEDARVLMPGQMLGLRREGTFWVLSRIEMKGSPA